jgi:hypothetical protein
LGFGCFKGFLRKRKNGALGDKVGADVHWKFCFFGEKTRVAAVSLSFWRKDARSVMFPRSVCCPITPSCFLEMMFFRLAKKQGKAV